MKDFSFKEEVSPRGTHFDKTGHIGGNSWKTWTAMKFAQDWQAEECWSYIWGAWIGMKNMNTGPYLQSIHHHGLSTQGMPKLGQAGLSPAPTSQIFLLGTLHFLKPGAVPKPKSNVSFFPDELLRAYVCILKNIYVIIHSICKYVNLNI